MTLQRECDTMDTEQLWKAWGAWFKKGYRANGLRQKDIVEATGISRQHIHAIEHGAPTKRATVIKLAKAAGLDLEQALWRAGMGGPSEPSETVKRLANEIARLLDTLPVDVQEVICDSIRHLAAAYFRLESLRQGTESEQAGSETRRGPTSSRRQEPGISEGGALYKVRASSKQASAS